MDDARRLDIVVPGLSVARGRPLFCDATVVSPISRTGRPRPGTSNRGGRLLEEATRRNNNDYHEVVSSGLGALYSLGVEVYGRWSAQCIELVPALARERARGSHPRVRKGMALGLQHRWWGLLGIALQRCAGHSVLNHSADLPREVREPAVQLADLHMP